MNDDTNNAFAGHMSEMLSFCRVLYQRDRAIVILVRPGRRRAALTDSAGSLYFAMLKVDRSSGTTLL